MLRFALALAVAVAVTAPAFAQGADYVSPYTRRDGTMVQGHFRSAPDSTLLNSYTTRGNTNPFTGEPGYRNPSPSYGGSYGQSSRSSGYGSSYRRF
ncbi:MAG: hypothetical protein E7K72_27800 [Roseomonas mucosa]|nr:hypothetical protein [Roseomonas mucosa]